MRKKFFLVWVLVCLVSVPGVRGFSVSAVTMNPAGGLSGDIPLTVTFDIAGKGIGLYDQLVMTTDLQSPVWDTRIVTNGKDTPVISAFQNGNILTIPGAVFNQKPGVQGTVNIQLNGTVPPDPSASRNLLHIRQVDAEGTEYAYPVGFDLTMPTPPTATPAPSRTEPEPVTTVQTTKVPSFGELIAAATPGVSSPPVPAPKNRTLSVPTSWAGKPPATYAPVDPVVSIGATGGVLYAIKRFSQNRIHRSCVHHH